MERNHTPVVAPRRGSPSHTSRSRTRQDEAMSDPSAQPWSDFASSAFLDEVLAARSREPDLTKACKGTDWTPVQAWVDSRWPTKFEWADSRKLPQPGSAPSNTAPEKIDYAGVVHNRPMNEEDTAERVASIVAALLTLQNVDEAAMGEVNLLEGEGWSEAVDRLGDAPPSPDWLWSVECGNHRLVAQHLLGIGPYAVVRTAESWS